jgi:hypothetical protein
MTISLVSKKYIKNTENINDNLKFDYNTLLDFCKTKTFFNILFIFIIFILFLFFMYMKKIYEEKNKNQDKKNVHYYDFIFPYNYIQN